MTSKFSQGSNVQTLPPVCHSHRPPFEPFTPPLYPDLRGYCQFQILFWDMTRKDVQIAVILPWDDIHNHWKGSDQVNDCYWNCTLTPQAPPLPVNIHVETYGLFGYVDNYLWEAPPYTPQEPWASGENYQTIPYYLTWAWHTFTTYH